MTPELPDPIWPFGKASWPRMQFVRVGLAREIGDLDNLAPLERFCLDGDPDLMELRFWLIHHVAEKLYANPAWGSEAGWASLLPEARRLYEYATEPSAVAASSDVALDSTPFWKEPSWSERLAARDAARKARAASGSVPGETPEQSGVFGVEQALRVEGVHGVSPPGIGGGDGVTGGGEMGGGDDDRGPDFDGNRRGGVAAGAGNGIGHEEVSVGVVATTTVGGGGRVAGGSAPEAPIAAAIAAPPVWSAQNVRSLIFCLGGPKEVAIGVGESIPEVESWFVPESIPQMAILKLWHFAAMRGVHWELPGSAHLFCLIQTSRAA